MRRGRAVDDGDGCLHDLDDAHGEGQALADVLEGTVPERVGQVTGGGEHQQPEADPLQVPERQDVAGEHIQSGRARQDQAKETGHGEDERGRPPRARVRAIAEAIRYLPRRVPGELGLEGVAGGREKVVPIGGAGHVGASRADYAPGVPRRRSEEAGQMLTS